MKNTSPTGLLFCSWLLYCENKCILWDSELYTSISISMNFVYFMLHFWINKHPKSNQFYRAAEIKWLVHLDKNHFSIFIHQNMIVLDWKALAKNALTLGNHQRGRGLFIGLAPVLARPFQPETIIFRWMKIETTQLLFVQSMLNQSSDLSDRIKLAKFRLFIYSKLEPKISKIYRNL